MIFPFQNKTCSKSINFNVDTSGVGKWTETLQARPDQTTEMEKVRQEG